MDKPFTVIKNPAVFNVERRIRLPLLGKIYLGVKEVSKKSGAERPKAVDYFVVPDEVKRVYGEQPKELDVMFPTEDISSIFPQALKRYGTSGIKCRGDGEKAEAWDEKTMKFIVRECPCSFYESGECSLRATLFVILYKVNMGGVYRIISGSVNSIGYIISGFEYHKLMVGRFDRLPLVLRRERMEISYINEKDKKKLKSIHFPLKIVSNLTLKQIARHRYDKNMMGIEPSRIMLPLVDPDDENPLTDKGGVRVPVDEFTDAETVDKPEENKPAEPPTATEHTVDTPAEQDIDEPPAPKPVVKTKEPAPKTPIDPDIKTHQRVKIMEAFNGMKWNTVQRNELTKFLYHKESLKELEISEAGDMITIVEGLLNGLYEARRDKTGKLVAIWDKQTNAELKF